MITRTVIHQARWIILLVSHIVWMTAHAATIPEQVLHSSQSYEKRIEWRDDIPLYMAEATQMPHKKIEVEHVTGFLHYQVFDHPAEASVSFLIQQWAKYYEGIGYQTGFYCSNNDCPPPDEWQQVFAPRATDSGSEQAYLSFTKQNQKPTGPLLEIVQIYLSEIGCCVRSTWRLVSTEESFKQLDKQQAAIDMSAQSHIIYFGSDDDHVSDSQAAQLRRQLHSMQSHNTQDGLIQNLRYQIQGHTDNMGAHQYNQSLSQQRANRVADLLHDMGIPRNQITVQYFGASKPLASNATDAGRKSNRRVTVSVFVDS